MDDIKPILEKYSWFKGLIESIQETYVKLGNGHLETVYQKSIEAHLNFKNISCSLEHTINYNVSLSHGNVTNANEIKFENKENDKNNHHQNNQVVAQTKMKNQIFKVGVGRCDIMIENEGILELKAQKVVELKEEDIRQLQNYLIHANLKIGIAVNFAKLPIAISPNNYNHSMTHFTVVILIHSSEFLTKNIDGNHNNHNNHNHNNNSSNNINTIDLDSIFLQYHLKIPLKLPSIYFPSKFSGKLNYNSLDL